MKTSIPAYRLLITPRSPFARRIRTTMARLEIPFEPVITDVFKPSDDFLKINPLGLIPVLIHPGPPAETRIPDSSAILEYLHTAHGGRVWPADPLEAARVRAASTWVQGIMAACVSHYLERIERPSPLPAWLEEQEDIIRRTLLLVADQNLGALPWVHQGKLTQAGWDLGIALEYMNLRVPGLAWETAHPGLVPVLEQCRRAPEFTASTPPPQ